MARKPFFMRFIEKQVEVKTNVKAGADDDKSKERKGWEKGYETMKYPSDNDEYMADW